MLCPHFNFEFPDWGYDLQWIWQVPFQVFSGTMTYPLYSPWIMIGIRGLPWTGGWSTEHRLVGHKNGHRKGICDQERGWKSWYYLTLSAGQNFRAVWWVYNVIGHFMSRSIYWDIAWSIKLSCIVVTLLPNINATKHEALKPYLNSFYYKMGSWWIVSWQCTTHKWSGVMVT